jgi:RNA polymerase sigma factor (sigma-70 family)
LTLNAKSTVSHGLQQATHANRRRKNHANLSGSRPALGFEKPQFFAYGRELPTHTSTGSDRAAILKISGGNNMNKYRTPKKDRATYVCRDAYGDIWMVLRPGENGVTEADIAAIHRADDDEWNNDYQQVRPHVCNPNGTVSYEELDEAAVWIGDNAANPLELIIADESETETKRTVHDAVDKLPPKQAQAITAVWLNGIAASDYAKSLGCSEANVSQILDRAFANLRKTLERN